jgi:hypothetical protein
MAIKGKNTVKKNMRAAIEKMISAAVRGAIKGGTHIRNQGQRETPVEFGFLVNSWFGPETFRTRNNILITFGLTAYYAPYVHEMVGANFRKPGSKAKFLEDPVKQNERRVLDYIRREIKGVTR